MTTDRPKSEAEQLNDAIERGRKLADQPRRQITVEIFVTDDDGLRREKFSADLDDDAAVIALRQDVEGHIVRSTGGM